MTKTTALVLSTLMTLGIAAGMNGIATKQYAAAERLAMAQYGQTHVALTQVMVVGHNVTA